MHWVTARHWDQTARCINYRPRDGWFKLEFDPYKQDFQDYGLSASGQVWEMASKRSLSSLTTGRR